MPVNNPHGLCAVSGVGRGPGTHFPLPGLLLLGALGFLACAKVDQGPGNTGASGGNGGPVGNGGGGPVSGTGGSMRGTMGGGGMGGEASCGQEMFDLIRKPAELMLVLDRSASMQKDSADMTSTGANDPTKWAQVVPALTEVITQTGGGTELLWGMKTFPQDGNGTACSNSPSTVTTRIDVPIAPRNASAMNAAIALTTPNGDGTPTAAAVLVALDYLKGLVSDNRKFILLATDGDPSCGGVSGALTGNGNAVADAVTAVTMAATAGIPTFVVGVGSKTTSLLTLNMLANAGGEARPDPNPLATKFYQVATQGELVVALQTITGQIERDCIFPFKKAPPVPENIAVKVMGTKAPFDSSNRTGWNYTDSTNMAVQVYGSWCEMIKTNAANMVQIVFGCPNIPIE
jgi:von Willebrand factor type A domain